MAEPDKVTSARHPQWGGLRGAIAVIAVNAAGPGAAGPGRPGCRCRRASDGRRAVEIRRAPLWGQMTLLHHSAATLPNPLPPPLLVHTPARTNDTTQIRRRVGPHPLFTDLTLSLTAAKPPAACQQRRVMVRRRPRANSPSVLRRRPRASHVR